MKRVRIKAQFDISPDDFEEQLWGHFSKWLTTTIEDEFKNYDARNIVVSTERLIES